MIKFSMPMRTVSLANASSREHWATKKRRKDAQLEPAYRQTLAARGLVKPVLKVTFTRVAPKAMDYANLVASFKHVQDGVCRALRIDDGSPLLVFEYKQEKGESGEYAVRVEVERVQDSPGGEGSRGG